MTRKTKAFSVNHSNSLLLLIIGVSLGWLVGLSVSPVLYIILGGVITLIVGAVGILVGLDQDSGNKNGSDSDKDSKLLSFHKRAISISPLPLALLILGLGIGACAGIYARTNAVFGPNPQKFAQKWAGTGLNEKIIQQRLFDQLYPPAGIIENPNNLGNSSPQNGGSTGTNEHNPDTITPSAVNSAKANQAAAHQSEKGSPIASQYSAGLYAVTADECGEMRLKHGEELRTILKSVKNERIAKLVDKCQYNDDCLEIMKELVCPYTK
jgi:hypothetical protein